MTLIQGTIDPLAVAPRPAAQRSPAGIGDVEGDADSFGASLESEIRTSPSCQSDRSRGSGNRAEPSREPDPTREGDEPRDIAALDDANPPGARRADVGAARPRPVSDDEDASRADGQPDDDPRALSDASAAGSRSRVATRDPGRARRRGQQVGGSAGPDDDHEHDAHVAPTGEPDATEASGAGAAATPAPAAAASDRVGAAGTGSTTSAAALEALAALGGAGGRGRSAALSGREGAPGTVDGAAGNELDVATAVAGSTSGSASRTSTRGGQPSLMVDGGPSGAAGGGHPGVAPATGDMAHAAGIVGQGGAVGGRASGLRGATAATPATGATPSTGATRATPATDTAPATHASAALPATPATPAVPASAAGRPAQVGADGETTSTDPGTAATAAGHATSTATGVTAGGHASGSGSIGGTTTIGPDSAGAGGRSGSAGTGGTASGGDPRSASAGAGGDRAAGRGTSAGVTLGDPSASISTPADASRIDLSVLQSQRPATGPAGSASSVSSAAPPTGPADIDQFLSGVLERIRTVATSGGPGLEARLQHPDLGSVRLVVSGQQGDVVRAELIASDRASADALSRALDRATSGHGLAGIDVRVRAESSAGGAGGFGSHERSDRNAPGDGRAPGEGHGFGERASGERASGERAFDGGPGTGTDRGLTGSSKPADGPSVSPGSPHRPLAPALRSNAPDLPSRPGRGIDLRA